MAGVGAAIVVAAAAIALVVTTRMQIMRNGAAVQVELADVLEQELSGEERVSDQSAYSAL